ncbi:MAG TPA: MarR family transcriptional regulator [Actinomycetota bacterium]|nr:MarR family transcriptional regulator [Actinomycetota bacterium]
MTRNLINGDAKDGQTDVARPPKELLRLWLRALTFTNMVEQRVRTRLRVDFGVTLPRFDVMAALYDAPEEGLSMGEVSRRLKVSNGNVTGIVERLKKEGLIQRRTKPDDRRSQLVRLTDSGRTTFEEMAEAHEGWIASMLSGLSEEEVEQLKNLLGKGKRSVSTSDGKEERR